MSNAAIFDQQALTHQVTGKAPLHHQNSPFEAEGILLETMPSLGYLTLRGDANDEAFRVGVNKALGCELPAKPLVLTQSEALSIQWLSPDEWLIVCQGARCFEFESALHEQLSGHFAVVNVSGGYTMISLSGDRALDVLYQSTAYDVHPRNFEAGKAVATTLAKATMLLRRPDEGRWELIVRRSFADYCWRWLVGVG